MGEPMLGQIMAFVGSYNPNGWAYCNGDLLEIQEFSALYSVCGTLYGGDGRSSFGLPDLRGRSPVGMGSGPGRVTRVIAQVGGIERVTLVTDQMPSHNHDSVTEIDGEVTATAHCYTGTANMQFSPTNSVMAQQGYAVSDDAKVYSRSAPNATMASSSITTQNSLEAATSIGDTGGSESHENMPPWLCLNYIVALEGYYPSRT